MRKNVMVFADWEGLAGPIKIGELHCIPVRGKEVFSFEYDKGWINSGKFHLLDPDLKLLTGPQYPGDDITNFGFFLDSSPDRWGRVLMNRREAYIARKEGRKPKPLLDSDYLLGVNDILRMGGLRLKTEESGQFLNDDQNLVIPPISRLRELEEASHKLEKDDSLNDPNYSAWLNLLLAPGSSIGGARPKANVADLKKELWIAKFPARSDVFDTGGWEMVVWELAKLSGLSVPERRENPLCFSHDSTRLH